MNTTKALAPYITALLLFGAWFALVAMKLAPAQDFLTALTGALAGLGVHSVHKGLAVQPSAVQPAKTNAPPAA